MIAGLWKKNSRMCPKNVSNTRQGGRVGATLLGSSVGRGGGVLFLLGLGFGLGVGVGGGEGVGVNVGGIGV